MTILKVVATVIMIAGLVWLGQGIGLIGGSFMTSQAIWAWIGAGMIATALALFRIARMRKG